jgi:cytoskeletal protein CcmA (bactofilin family)
MINKAVDFIKNIFNKKGRQKETVADFHTTIIKVDDNFISASSIMLDEKLFGNIFSLKEVNIAAPSEISGNIISRSCIISGIVTGDIRASEYAEIKSTANIVGNILARSIMIEPGAIINGSIRIDGAIDERELIEKVESRLQFQRKAEIIADPYLIAEPADLDKEPENELIPKAIPQTDRPPEVNKRTVISSTKGKLSKPADLDDNSKTSTNSWY